MSYCCKCENSLPVDGGIVTCVGCKGELHYDCAKLKNTTYNAMSNKRKQDWRCEFCRLANKIAEIIFPKFDKNLFTSIITPIKEEFSDLKLKVNECLEGQKAIAEKYDNLIKNCNDINHKISNLEQELAQIKKVNAEKDNTLNALQIKINKFDQVQLQNDIVLYDVDEREREDLFEVLSSIGVNIDFQLQKENLVGIRRITGDANRQTNLDNRPRPIRITFKNNELKTKFLKCKKNKVVKNSDIIENGSNNNIKIYEMLTPYYKKLLYQTRMKANEKQWKYVWVSYGQIRCRKEDGSKVLFIHGEMDLNKLD